MIVCLLCVALLLTACSNKNNAENQVSETEGESFADIPEEYAFGSSTLPWQEPPEDWTPVVDESSGFGLQEQVLSAENPAFSHEGVTLTMVPDFILEPLTLQVQPVKLPPPWEGAAMNAYDFSIEGIPEGAGVMEIRIPYPEAGNVSGDSITGAGYFNEETKQWEPVAFWLDEANKQVVITTNHLSIYSCFTVTGEETRYARITQIFAIPVLPEHLQDKYTDVLLEAINNGLKPGQEALGLGLKMNSEWMGFSDAMLSLNALAYSSEFLDDLSNAFANVGAAMALVQMAADYNRGEPDALLGNALKNITSFVVSKFGNSIMSAAYVSVFAIDYSLSKLIEETLKDRKDIWANAYAMYYKEKHFRDAVAWYQVMRRLQEKSVNLEQFKEAVDQELNNYTRLFWNEPEETIAFYQSEAQAGGFTGGGGLNAKLKDDISNAFKMELMTGRLQPVFDRLQQEHMMCQQEEYRRELEKLANQLNRVVKLTITEKFKGNAPRYAGYYVKFAPLNDKTDPKQWTGRLNGDGRLRATFTVLGHMEAGFPSKIQLFPDIKALEQDRPELTVDFIINVPETEVIIESRDRLKKLIPKRPTEEMMNMILVEDANSSYFSENTFPFPIEHLLSQKPILIPENDVIDVNLSGHWSSPTEQGTNKSGTWFTNYSYSVDELALKINLTQNEELPVIGTNTKALRLEGTGTYQYQVTVTTVRGGVQEMPSLTGGKATVKGDITSRVTLVSSGDVKLTTESRAIDSSQKVILREEGIENLETTGIVLKFQNPETSFSGVRQHKAHTKWGNGEEKEESWTTDIEGEGGLSANSDHYIYFKYPVD
jgi:hypothetical protein